MSLLRGKLGGAEETTNTETKNLLRTLIEMVGIKNGLKLIWIHFDPKRKEGAGKRRRKIKKEREEQVVSRQYTTSIT